MHTRRMVVAVVALCALFVSFLLLPEVAASEGAREPARPLAEMSLGASRVDWQPAGDYKHLTLTVAGPEGVWLRREFTAGQSASLDLLDQNGQQLPDGNYVYELRFAPAKAGSPKRPILQAGSFAVRDGSFTASFEERKATEPQTRNAPTAPEVLHDKSITPANACIGALCVAGDDAVYPILRLKDYYGVGILFDDVFDNFSYSRNWLLQANPNLGGPDHFFLQDVDAGTTPFSVQGNAPDYSLVVATGGNVGVGTATPAKDLTVVSSDTPTLRLEQSFNPNPARSWDLGANHTELFIKDVTNSSSVPFRIKAGAPTSTIEVTAAGDVGLGTSSPASQLHVRGTDSGFRNRIFVENASGTTTPREMLEIRNNGGAVFIFKDTSVAQRWGVGTFGSSFLIDNQANAGIELTLSSTGNLTVAGTVTPGSSRTIKEEFSPVDSRDVLHRVLDLPITTWSYKATPGVRHVGPMSEDFFAAFAVGSDDKGISVTDSAGVALAAIQGLSRQVAEVTAQKDGEIAQLRHENADLAQRLAALEALVLQNRREEGAEAALKPAP